MAAPNVTPYRQEPVGRDGFAQLLRAEFTKFRTVRAWVVTLAVAAVLIVAFGWVGSQDHSGTCTRSSNGASTCSTSGPPHVPVGPGGEPVVDTFSFLHQPLTGNGSVTARVTSLTAVIASKKQRTSAPWAKAGIIIKENTTQGSAYTAVMLTPSHGVRLQYNYVHDSGGLPGTASASSPRWLRLTRSGDVLTGYDSLDGTHWTKIGTVHLRDLTHIVQAGLFVTSPVDYSGGSNPSSPSLATATFEQVHLHGDFPHGSWNRQVVGANTQTYLTQPTGSNWFQQSDGTFTISGSGDIAPQVAGGSLPGTGDTMSLLAGGTFGLIAVIVLATLFITSEYRRGLIRTTLAASPRRGRVLTAKAVVIGSVTFVAASIATAAAVAISRHELAANGNYVFPLGTPDEVRVIVGTGLLFAVAAIGVMALGTILRRSAGAVVIGIVLFVLPFILGSALSGASDSGGSDWLMRITPTAAFAIQGTLPRFAQVANAYTLRNGYYPLGPWIGLAVLGGYAAVAFGAAMWSIRRRDV